MKKCILTLFVISLLLPFSFFQKNVDSVQAAGVLGASGYVGGINYITTMGVRGYLALQGSNDDSYFGHTVISGRSSVGSWNFIIDAANNAVVTNDYSPNDAYRSLRKLSNGNFIRFNYYSFSIYSSNLDTIVNSDPVFGWQYDNCGAMVRVSLAGFSEDGAGNINIFFSNGTIEKYNMSTATLAGVNMWAQRNVSVYNRSMECSSNGSGVDGYFTVQYPGNTAYLSGLYEAGTVSGGLWNSIPQFPSLQAGRYEILPNGNYLIYTKGYFSANLVMIEQNPYSKQILSSTTTDLTTTFSSFRGMVGLYDGTKVAYGLDSTGNNKWAVINSNGSIGHTGSMGNFIGSAQAARAHPDGNVTFFGMVPDPGFSQYKIGFQTLTVNQVPILTVSNANGDLYSTDSAFSTLNVNGFAQDLEGDNLTITANILGTGVSKSIVLTNPLVTQPFQIQFDVNNDNIPTGIHTVYVTASDDFGGTISRSFTIVIKVRVSNNSYIFVNDLFYLNPTTYSDVESDPKIDSRWKFTQDSSFFENPNGSIADSGQWRTSVYNSLAYSGRYSVVFQDRDMATNTAGFGAYSVWSQDSFTTVNLNVHRRPIASYTVAVYSNGSGGFIVTPTDSSYDLDKQSTTSRGISQWEWKYKKTTDTTWVAGQPPQTISANTNYQMQLRVFDEQGAWSNPTIVSFTTSGAPVLPPNAIPVATMTSPNGSQVRPTIVSSIRPTFTWSQTDADASTTFIYFQLQVTNEANTITLLDSGQYYQGTASTSGSWIANADLPAGQKLRVRVRTFDGTAWSNYSAQTWLFINRAPTGTLTVSPSNIYEYDDPTVTINPSDPDGDSLTILVESSFNGSAYSTIYLANGIASGTAKAFQIFDIPKGSYSLRLTLTDPSGASFVSTTILTVLDLNLTGSVQHTTDWDANRQAYNAAHTSSPRSYDTYWAGEQFNLLSIVTNTGTATIPTSVTTTLLVTGDVATLASLDNVNWSGSLWQASYVNLADGVYTFRFRVTWNNGNMETYDYDITIDAKIYAYFVTQLRN